MRLQDTRHKTQDTRHKTQDTIVNKIFAVHYQSHAMTEATTDLNAVSNKNGAGRFMNFVRFVFKKTLRSQRYTEKNRDIN